MAETVHKVTITEIDIPFWRIVGILIKWSIAAIPAVLIVSLVVTLVGAALSMIFGFSMHWLDYYSAHRF